MSASLPSHTGDHRERKAAARVARRQEAIRSIAEQLDEGPDWRPLEAFARAMPAVDPAEFMWMGVALAGSTLVHLYKHGATRRYLNLDASGHAYLCAIAPDVYVPLATAAEAVALLELDDPCNYYRENP